ncbi:MAG: hypothetical protein LBK06_07525 [Planctomycetaceae bacterium]|nr:hypothetical protein [Planctomycetaceae bacterium]
MKRLLGGEAYCLTGYGTRREKGHEKTRNPNFAHFRVPFASFAFKK